MTDKKSPRLSQRLGAVFDMVPPCGYAVDVGCDHGYIPIALLQSGRCSFALACDVNKGPLSKAEENAANAGAGERIAAVLSDGLGSPEIYEAIASMKMRFCGENAEGSLIIAGMGGVLMARILDNAPDLENTFSCLVLQPQSDVPLIRRWAAEHGWQFERETMLKEDGKYYVLFALRRGSQTLTAEEEAFGPILLRDGNPVLTEYLLKQREEKMQILRSLSRADASRAEVRRAEVTEELHMLEKVLKGDC